MANSKFSEYAGLPVWTLKPGVPRNEVDAHTRPFTFERRMANEHNRAGGQTFERQLSDGRWLQSTNAAHRTAASFQSVQTLPSSNCIRNVWSTANVA